MDDDFDKFLDSFEKDLGGKKAQAAAKGKTVSNGELTTPSANFAHSKGGSSFNSQSQHGGHSLSSMMNDILSDEIEVTRNSTTYQQRSSPVDRQTHSHEPASSLGVKSCYQVLLGGSQFDLGVSTNGDQVPCAKLRCIDCDFVIESFNDSAWKADTDYLFLRNNMPDRKKLAQQLVRKAHSRAYCCQCKFTAVVDLTPVQRVAAKVRWACAKHA